MVDKYKTIELKYTNCVHTVYKHLCLLQNMNIYPVLHWMVAEEFRS